LADNALSSPCYGAAFSYLWRKEGLALPAVALPHLMYNVVVLPGQSAGFLGAAYQPFQVESDPNSEGFGAGSLVLPPDVSAGRLEHREGLMRQLDDRFAAAKDLSDLRMGTYYERAFSLLRSEAVRRGFNMAAESPVTRDRYGRTKFGQSLLLARRLVETGVRFVTVYDGQSNCQTCNWDSHSDNFPRHRDVLLPPVDRGFSALVEDLDARGLLESTLVVALGEFGRTPRINGAGGRDHWPDCFSVVLAGGGVKGGSIHGSSDRLGAYPETDPVTPGDLAATLFWQFGIDPHSEVHDFTGRPYRLAEGRPLVNLFEDDTSA
jgi:hypothetical protein